MKVLMVNGSPHEKGCTYTALHIVGEALENAGIQTDTFWIGNQPLTGCIGCGYCVKNGKCRYKDKVNEFLGIAKDYDGFVFGVPVVSSRYWNMVHGQTPEQVLEDEEGVQIMRVLGKNMAWILKCIEAGRREGLSRPESEARISTNYIRYLG